MAKGVCYGVSVGPGQEDLITLQAVDIIQKSNVIFIPSFPKEECKAYQIIKKILPDIDEKEICPETFTMSKDSTVMEKRHLEIYDNARRFLDDGKTVAFLTLGEVALYSTYLYIHDLLSEGGYESVLINGISSVQAACAKLGIPLALGKSELHIFPNADNLEEKLKMPGTKVFMKSRLGLPETIKKIQTYCEQNDNTISCGVSNLGMDGEVVARQVNELSKLNGYFTVIIVVD